MFKKPYFIGIKGAGMVGLSTLLHNEGAVVRGSDTSEVFFSDAILQKRGIVIDDFTKIIPKDCDQVIYSAAYDQDHPQRRQAMDRNIPQISYFEAVGTYAQNKTTISVIGTHGKTTTSAYLGVILHQLGLGPSVLIGSQVQDFDNQTVLIGQSDIFVVEACEYQNHFFHIKPDYSICTNIDYDHVDFFSTPEMYRDAFVRYISQVSPDNLVSHASCELGFGTVYDQTHHYFELLQQHQNHNIIGDHLRQNFCAAILMAKKIATDYDFDLEDFDSKVVKAFTSFSGITHRMQYYGVYNGALLYDDYGHHPVEIQKTLAGIKKHFPNKKIHLVFQSHTFTRTKQFEKEFIHSFIDADCLYLAPIFSSAREVSVDYDDTHFLAAAKKDYPDLFYGSFEEIHAKLVSCIGEGDLVIAMGAGDAWQIVRDISNIKNER